MSKKEKMVKAYLVASSFMPEGHLSLDEYGEGAHPLMEKYGGKLVIAGFTDQDLKKLEGVWQDHARITVFEFPSMDHLMGFWNDPDYIAVKHLRHEATPPNFTMAVEAYNPDVFSYERD